MLSTDPCLAQTVPVPAGDPAAYSEQRPVIAISATPVSVASAEPAPTYAQDFSSRSGTVSHFDDENDAGKPVQFFMPGDRAAPAAVAPVIPPMPAQQTETVASAPTQAQLNALVANPAPIIGEANIDILAPKLAAGKSIKSMPKDRAVNPVDLAQVSGLATLPETLSGAALAPSYKNSEIVRAVNMVKVAEPAGSSSNAPVDLEADDLQHDDTNKIITATGHVSLKQMGKTLRADRVVYNLNTDQAYASGHVIFTDASGNVHFADSATMRNQMKDGVIEGMKTYLAKGGRFTAVDGTRENATITTMHNVTYTTCECEEDSHGNPPWAIKAKKAVYNEPEHNIVYSDATLDVLGTPVFWSPYFSSGDGQIKQQSGFLSPVLGYNSRLGANATERYYWGIAPDKDITIGAMALTNKAPVLSGEYRERFDNARINLNGSVTDSSYDDKIGDLTVHKDDTARSYLFGTGLWDMSDTWRSGFQAQVVSDDQYLRQYRISGENVLDNELYAERFSGRDYTLIRGLAFQDIRVLQDKVDQPIILPEITSNFQGEPNETLGGRWDATFSGVGLSRDAGEDLGRASVNTGWQRRFTTDFGLVTTADGRVRGDLYAIGDRERDDYDPSRPDGSAYRARWLPDANIVSSYPFAKPLERAQIVIAPEVSMTAAPNIDIDKNAIPDEDSKDVQLDVTNLFQANRFAGYDRLEDGSHASYGVRTGLYGYEGSKGEVFLGQSHRFIESNPFPDGSGLSRKSSDYVGQVTGNYGSKYGMDYRFDLDSQTLASERHELYSYAKFRRFQLTSRYIYDKALQDTDIIESRQQLFNNVNIRLTNSWSLLTGTVYDLGREEGLRRAAVSVNYLGCCIALSFNVSRNFTTSASESNGTDFTVRLFLKGLGGFPKETDPDARADFNLSDIEYSNALSTDGDTVAP